MCDSCGGHGGIGGRVGMISNIHSNYRRELLGEDIFVPDNEQTALIREKLEYFPDRLRYLIEMGDALVYQMRYKEALVYFERAHEIRPTNYEVNRKLAIRYLSTLQIEKSREYFKWCVERLEDTLDEEYRLALLDYYEGNYSSCIEKLQPCYHYARNNGEMYVAVLFWDLISRVKLGEDITEVLDKFNTEIDCGHHIGYQQALILFKYDDLGAIKGVEGNGDLASSLYMYGLYHYYLYKEDNKKANETLCYLMTLDTYFSSFAFLGAFIDYRRMQKEEQLINNIKALGSVAVACSGGVDSTYLAYAVKASGADYKAYYVNSELQAKEQVEEMFDVETNLDLNVSTITLKALDNKDIIKNGGDRCYHCKKQVFSKIKEEAEKEGYKYLVDGTNLDDTNYYRPGVKAIEELGVLSPLKDAGLTKNEIRQLMREHNIVGANKPANSCLATRIYENEQLTFNKLKDIEMAETILLNKGYKDFRVRVKEGVATLEFNITQKDKVEKEFEILKNEIQNIFSDVSLSENWRN